MRLIPLALILAIAATLPACRRPGTSSGATNLPFSPLSLNLATAPVVGFPQNPMYPDFELTDPEILQSPLVFANTRNDDQNLYVPTILRNANNVWRKITIPSLDHTAWVYAGASIERSELWAILDSASPTRGPGLYLLRSTDGGATWDLFSAIRPPSILAEFTSFTINADGKAVVTVHQDDDTGEAPRGLYTYRSTDGARSWADPAYTSDDLVSADPPAYPTLVDTLKQIAPQSPVPAAPANLPQRPTPNFRPFNRNFQSRPFNGPRGNRRGG